MVKCTPSSLCITEFPAICTGTRSVLMSVNDSVPSIVNVHGFECRFWYPGQPAYCAVCRSSGHLPRACPLSGLCRRCKQPGHVARECVQARIQPRPPAPLTSDPVVPDLRPPSPPDPVPPAPSASSSTSVSSSLSPDQIALKRLICKSLPEPPSFTLTWSSPEINSFVDGLLSQSSFSVSLRDFAVSYMVAENCQSKNPPFEGKIVLFIIIFSSDLYICFFLFTNLFIYLIFDEIK